MKLLYLNYMVDLYGASIGSTIKAKKLFKALERLGHSVTFYWLSERPQRQEDQEQRKSSSSLLRDLLYTPKQMLRNIPQWFRERRILRRERPDAVIVRLDAFRMSAWWACRFENLPMIVEADGANSYEWLTFNNGRHLWDSVLLWCERRMLTHAVGVFTQSQEAKDYFKQQHGVREDKITVITNAADPVTKVEKSDIAVLKQALQIPDEAQVIGFLGSMHHWHGIRDVYQMIHGILHDYPNALFLFVGSGGALEAELKSQLQDADNRVRFTGTVDNDRVQSYVQLFDIAIAPYPPIDLFYFSPMKIFEYMAAGKPIVTAGLGQMTRILQHEESALFYEPGNLVELQQQIERLLKNSQLQKIIARNAYESFVNSHTWKHKATELDEFLNHCLAPTSKRGTKGST